MRVRSSDRGRPVTAQSWATRALHRLQRDCPGETSLHAKILITLANQRAMLGDLPEALGLLDEAERVDPAAHIRAEANRGEFFRASRPSVALDHFEMAIAGLRADRSADGQEALAITLLNRGVLHMSAGRLRQAQADTDGAAVAARQSGNDVVLFMATHNHGYVQFLAGNLPGALNTMAAASDVRPDGATGVSALDRARVLLSAGLIAEARDFADQAVESFAKTRATADLADALAVRAEIEVLVGDSDAARADTRRAARIAIRRGNDRAALAIEVLEQRAAARHRHNQPIPIRGDA